MRKIRFRITKAEKGAAFAVTVVPKAKRNEIVGRYGDAIKVKIAAPPEEGRANEELLSFLAEKLGVKREQLEIVAGASSRNKIISVTGMEPAEVEKKLLL
ncbi:MAG: DUF167 domain-containing protein [Anaerolineae bacterium]|nr:DUF167 domain-containing protein [Anaerolineae bacterium]MDW8103074.1 DUF167 domain-containing protein [Anaerolineae bacterium]